MLLQLFFQIMMLHVRNAIVEVMSKLAFPSYSNLLNWYSKVEERLQFEEYEDPDQIFNIKQYPPLF